MDLLTIQEMNIANTTPNPIILAITFLIFLTLIAFNIYNHPILSAVLLINILHLRNTLCRDISNLSAISSHECLAN